MRNKSTTSLVLDAEREADAILRDFSDFTHGCRVVLLLQRTKEGGHNDEYKRRRMREVCHNHEQLKKTLIKAIILKETAENDHRIYMSASPRDIRKAEMKFKEDQLQADFAGNENKTAWWESVADRWISALMATNPLSGQTLFVLDIDTKDNGAALKWCEDNKVEIVKVYPTKQGWHIVTKPFNQSLFPAEIGSVKKDGLLLVSF